MERMPPNDQKAEESLLGSMLRDNAMIREVEGLVQAEDFYNIGRRRIFECAIELAAEEKKFDMVTAADWLKAKNYLDEVGGYGYLAMLWDAAPCITNAEEYAKIIRQHAVVRRLIHLGSEIAKKASSYFGNPEELIGEVEAEVFSIARSSVVGETVTIAEAVEEEYWRYDEASKTKCSGLKTELIDLDRLTGGLQESELILLAARPSVGKTSLALQFAQQLGLNQQIPVFFASVEMSRRELATRLMCAEAKVNGHHYRTFKVDRDGLDRIRSAVDILKTAKIFIDDNSYQTVLRIASNARRLKAKHDIRLVVIDYLQLVESYQRTNSRQEDVASISRGLKRLARELQIPVLALAQLNRNTDENERPRLSDLRESGALEQDADTVMMMYRPEKDDRNKVSIVIAKQRNGPVGDIDVLFNQQTMTFMNFAGGYPDNL